MSSQDGVVLFLLFQENEIAAVIANHVLVRGDHHHLEAVDGLELESFRVGGTGHTRQLVVKPEVVLKGNGCQGLVLRLDRHPFLGFDCSGAGHRTSAGRSRCVQ